MSVETVDPKTGPGTLGLLRDVRKVWSLPEFAEHRRELAPLRRKTAFWLVIAEAYAVIQVYPVKPFMDAVATHDRRQLLWSVLLITLSFSGESVLRLLMDRPRIKFFFRSFEALWDVGHRKELSMSADWHRRYATGEKESMIGKNVQKVNDLVDETIYNALPVAARVVFTALGVGLFIGWLYGLLALTTLAAFCLLSARFSRAVGPERKEIHEVGKAMESKGNELTKTWRTIKAFGLEDAMSSDNQALLRDYSRREISFHEGLFRHFLHQNLMIAVSRGGLYALLGFSSGANIGAIALTTTWMEKSYANLYRLSDYARQVQQGIEALHELVGIMLTAPTVGQPDAPRYPADPQGAVEFHRVGYKYPEGHAPALSDVTFEAAPGTVIAVIGPSGSGKTTLASLMNRESDPTAGEIRYDGIPLTSFDYDRFRREYVAVVTQQVELFNGTIADNLLVTRPDATHEEMVECAKLAYIHDFVQARPDGYDTRIGEDGLKLSGGQRQRLAIARALLRRPKLLILDEATSALDAESQEKVKESINTLVRKGECTTLIIAHRLSTVEAADLVIVMEDGRIAEMGTHDDLRAGSKLYNRLVALETAGFVDPTE